MINGGGADSIDAGDNDDLVNLTVGYGADTIICGAGRDTLSGSTLTTATTIGFTSSGVGTFGDGSSKANFSQMEDFVTGSGHDTIKGGLDTGNFTYDTGLGNDVINAGSGNETITSGDGEDYVVALAGNDVVYGGAGNDQLFGGDGNDSVFGGDGNDSILGGAGEDTLEGGLGYESLWSGLGNDSLSGDEGNDLQGRRWR